MTDEYIVDQILKGYTHYFSEIVTRYKDKVFNTSYRFANDYNEAQDISQELFITVFKNLPKYNETCRFSTWLYRIHYNLCIDWYRKNKKRLKQLNIHEENFDMEDKKFNLEEDFIAKQEKIAVRNGINKLKGKYRTALILYHYQGLSYEEISEVMKIPIKTVETRLYRARNLLRKKLSSYDYGGEFDEVQSSSIFNG